jgi:hypothetical protein
LLPWNLEAARRRAAHAALQKCFVRRAWLRFALNQLGALIASKSHDALIWFNYADGVLSMKCDEERIVVSAKGVSWLKPIAIPADELRDLPKRLTRG